MTVHKMKLSAIPFEKIVSGKKIIESRLYDEKRRQISLGDKINFTCSNNQSKSVSTTITALYRYPNFENLFSDFSPSLFGGNSKEELIEEIKSFYSKEEQEKYGVIGIKIEVIK
ncbi:MAG: ASCH domain-containing protein [Candidatus Pacebacteria bacterium]|nr:ASCH domain-containing protein [Candidatus Paceibacterota bacterium]